jgi:F-type H+-transporting ATPase subunit epsilon
MSFVPQSVVNSDIKLHVDIVSPEGEVLSEEVSMVILPSAEGDMGVLPKHAPMVVVLHPGVVTAFVGKEEKYRIFVGGGVANVREDSCTVLADDAIKLSDIKPEDVENYLAEIKAKMKEQIEREELEDLEKNFAIAEAKLELWRRLVKGL